MNQRPSKIAGFSLIELMIVLAVLGVLAAIGYPSYVDNVRQSKRSDAVSSIVDLQLRQLKIRANCRFYAGALGAADNCGNDAASTTVNFPAASKEGYYTLAVAGASGNAFTITATAVGSQTTDTPCLNITLTVDGANPDGLKAPAECW